MKVFGKDLTQAKSYRTGTHRSRSPEETLAAYEPLMSRFGIVRLANVTGLDNIGLPVYVSIRPNSRSLSVSQGKGVDRASAKASALMESIEMWHAERVSVPMRHESYLALRASEPVVDITELPLKKGSQLRLDVPMLFVQGYDLCKSAPVWVPHESVTTNFVKTRSEDTFVLSSNGLASGNHPLEAIVHGLCEVIERDALSLWNTSGAEATKARQIRMETVVDPCCVSTLRLLAQAGVGAVAWDITSDVGIPAHAVTIFEESATPGWRSVGMFSGYGCHLSPEVSLMRALSEAVQSRLTMISGSRDDMFYKDYLNCTNEDDRQQFMTSFAEPPPQLDARSRQSLATDTFEGDVAVLLSALERVGIKSVAVVDLSREDVGIPVVKVVVPGLEGIGIARSYVPGKRARAQMARAK
jgi:YcaO-like protein with predicted kinase domain